MADPLAGAGEAVMEVLHVVEVTGKKCYSQLLYILCNTCCVEEVHGMSTILLENRDLQGGITHVVEVTVVETMMVTIEDHHHQGIHIITIGILITEVNLQ